jgi:2-polyprenyl-6-methoxyphenol hydroxylase-like FAD-dependent oxidoreductase
MSSSLALVISCSSAASGSAPGRAYRTTPSRMIISVGMDEMPNLAASSGSAPVSTLPNTAPACRSDAFSKTGPNIRHGPHHAAQKSTSTRPSPLTVASKFSAVSLPLCSCAALAEYGLVAAADRGRAHEVPVLVVGGGPAGLAAAAELAWHGVGCVLLEPRTEVSHRRPRAKTTSIRTMEHLRRWGAAGALRAAAPLPVAWSQRVTFCECLCGRRITDFDGAFGLTPGRDDRFAESGQQVPQPVVEEVLRAHLRRQSGVELRLGHTAKDLTQDAEGVTVAVSDQAGSGYLIRARYVLGCDGAAGVTRDQTGARYAGRSDPRPNFNVVFRAPSLDTHLGPAVQYWVVGAGREATSGLIGRLDLAGTWWAIVPGADAAYGTAHADELITGLAGAPVEHEVLATDLWTARMLIADRFGAGRVFLVGESAHVNPPWGGHGFNTSVGDAVNIAWKLAAVTCGWAPADLLASYEPERRGVIEATVASAEANNRFLAGVLPRDAAAIQRAKRAEFYSLGLVLGYSYAGSPVIQPGVRPAVDVTSYTPSAEPGARLPHHWLPDGSSLYDRLGRGFTLVGPVRKHAGAAADLVRRARRRRIPLTLAEAPASYPWRDEFLLVRPDQHIAWRAGDPAGTDLETAAGFPGPAA